MKDKPSHVWVYPPFFWNSKNHWKIKVFDTAEVDVECCWISRLLIRLSNLEMVQGFCVRHLSSINKGGPRLFYRGDAGISQQGAGTTMPQWQQSQTAPVCGAVRDGMKMGCLFWFQSSFNVSDRLGVLIICRSFFSSSLVSCLCGFHHILSHSFTGSLSSYLDHVCVCEEKIASMAAGGVPWLKL